MSRDQEIHSLVGTSVSQASSEDTHPHLIFI